MESNVSQQNKKNNVRHHFVRTIIIIIILSYTVFRGRKSYTNIIMRTIRLKGDNKKKAQPKYYT